MVWVCLRSEVSQKEKKILYINAYIWNPEKWYRWTYLQGRNRYVDIEKGLVDSVGGRVGRTGRAALAYIHHHVWNRELMGSFYTAQDFRSVLCDGLEGSDGVGWEGGSRGRGVCVHTADSCCHTAETNSIVKQLPSNNKIKKKLYET